MAKQPKPPTEPVRISKGLVKDIKIVAASLDMSVPDYVSSRLRSIVDRDLAKTLKTLQSRPAPDNGNS